MPGAWESGSCLWPPSGVPEAAWAGPGAEAQGSAGVCGMEAGAVEGEGGLQHGSLSLSTQSAG